MQAFPIKGTIFGALTCISPNAEINKRLLTTSRNLYEKWLTFHKIVKSALSRELNILKLKMPIFYFWHLQYCAIICTTLHIIAILLHIIAYYWSAIQKDT